MVVSIRDSLTRTPSNGDTESEPSICNGHAGLPRVGLGHQTITKPSTYNFFPPARCAEIVVAQN